MVLICIFPKTGGVFHWQCQCIDIFLSKSSKILRKKGVKMTLFYLTFMKNFRLRRYFPWNGHKMSIFGQKFFACGAIFSEMDIKCQIFSQKFFACGADLNKPWHFGRKMTQNVNLYLKNFRLRRWGSFFIPKTWHFRAKKKCQYIDIFLSMRRVKKCQWNPPPKILGF